MLACTPSMAEQTPVSNGDVPATTPAVRAFSQQELDQLLAPIALSPDTLLAHVFMGSIYPLEIIEAACWVKANPQCQRQGTGRCHAAEVLEPVRQIADCGTASPATDEQRMRCRSAKRQCLPQAELGW